MLQHHLKTTFRYLREHTMFSAINLTGLATALCVVYFAFLYVKFELSYDKFNKNISDIYRISADVQTAAGINFETSSAALAGAIQTSIPGVKATARIFLDYYIVQKGLTSFGEETLAYADPSVFTVFSFPLIKGDPQKVFEAPYNLVLSETAAKKYFGSLDCVGETLTLDGNITATITGVMKDIPQNSHFRTDMFLSMSSLIKPNTNWMSDWSRFGFSTYVLLDENTSQAQLQKQLPALAKEHPLKNNLHYSLTAESLKTLYLQGKPRGNKAGSTATGSYRNIYIFSMVALFVLFIACFNFINLTTAFSLKRSKETGIRKVMGASRKQLTAQFLTDALMLSFFSFIIAMLLCQVLIPWFNQLTGKTLATGMFSNIRYLFLFLGIATGAGLLAGLYPAFLLSGLEPVTSLQGKFIAGAKGLLLRKSFVVAQFTISIILIAATLIVYRQLNFMKNENLGFKKEHNIAIDFHYDPRIIDHHETVELELTKLPGVNYASVSSAIPGRPNKKFLTTISGFNNESQALQVDGYFVDYNFIKQYGLQVIAGRAFSKNFATDEEEGMIVNEAMVKKLGYQNAADIVGKSFTQRGKNGYIIGVVNDFHFHSLHEEIQPLTIMLSQGFYTFLTLTIPSNHVHETIKNIEKKWAHLAPGLPMIYTFTDETYNAQYVEEDRFGKLFMCFAGLAILISCLGLLGLSSFNTIQRTKEIGVRKVLGASTASILDLLMKEFLLLVIISFIIATPAAWILMNRWLNNFHYRISIGYQYFLIAGGIALLIAFITISYISFKAATSNPVKALRTE